MDAQGLMDNPWSRTGSKVPASVTQSIIELKKKNPGYGAQHITGILKRFFLVGTGASAVQRPLVDARLTGPR